MLNKELTGKTVRLKYRFNGYNHDQVGIIKFIDFEDEYINFKPFELSALKIEFSKIDEVIENPEK